METRIKVHVHGEQTSGFAYNEEWMFRGRMLNRHRALPSYPWRYRWNEKDKYGHEIPLSQEEISAFKKSRSVKS